MRLLRRDGKVSGEASGTARQIGHGFWTKVLTGALVCLVLAMLGGAVGAGVIIGFEAGGKLLNYIGG